MKQALLFITGVVVGVVGVALYEIFGKAAEPIDDIWQDLYYDDTKPVRVK